MDRRRLILLCGPAFSGKTSLARGLETAGFVNISLDAMLRGRGLEPGAGLALFEWEQVSHAASMRIREEAQRGRSIVLDDTLCYRFLRDRYKALGSQLGMSVELVVLRISDEEVLRRVAVNEAETGRPGLRREVLIEHLRSFEWPGDDETAIELDATRPLEENLLRILQPPAGGIHGI